jgi:outer membrane biogenesis lipoprotein LolB
MKRFSHFVFYGLLLVGIWFLTGCASFEESQSKVADDEHWQALHDSLYPIWYDNQGNLRSH